MRILFTTLLLLSLLPTARAQTGNRVPPPYKQEMPILDSVMRLDTLYRRQTTVGGKAPVKTGTVHPKKLKRKTTKR
jgi:hypothetical protein